MRLAGYNVVITGAARGLGAAAARALASADARVVVADLDGDAAVATAREIDPTRSRVIGLRCDVTREEDCACLVAAAERFFGAPIDVFLAHAGVGFAGDLRDAPPAAIRRAIDVNVTGSILSAQAALRSLVNSKRACLLFTSSLQGVTARPQRSAYTASKHALVGLVKALALEFGPHGVRVNAVAPASIDGPFLRAQLASAPDIDAAVARVGAAMPLGRLVTEQDFTNAVLFLASPLAGAVTGHTLLVDCGAAAGISIGT